VSPPFCPSLSLHLRQLLVDRESLTHFHSRSAPNISILDYLRRIVRFVRVEVCNFFLTLFVLIDLTVFFSPFSLFFSQKSILLLTLHYIDQICARMPLFTLSSLTCHRFLITAIVVASKGYCDVCCTNTLYAKVGGISVAELNALEREFLRAIDWRLTVSPSPPLFLLLGSLGIRSHLLLKNLIFPIKKI
jgi:hypothetical protein